MRAPSFRASVGLVVATTLALASIGLGTVPASAVSIAGTFTPATTVVPHSNIGTLFTDDSVNSSNNIPGATFEVFFSTDAVTPSKDIVVVNQVPAVGRVLVTSDPVEFFTIRQASAARFQLKSFLIQDSEGINPTYTARGYRNGVVVGTLDFTVPQGGGFDKTVTLDSTFSSVDQVRVTSTGHLQNPGMLWGEGFANFVVADASTQADLSGLSLSAGSIGTFDSATTSYSGSVANAVASTTVTPTVTAPGATVRVNTVAVASGAASNSIALNVGANIITTVVTATDGSTTKTYTTTITRAAPPSSNANLSNLTLSVGALTPTFAAGTTSYSATVPFATTSLTVTPTKSDSGSTITVNSANVTSGNASGSIALAVGANTITTVVTAQDGSTTKTYTTTITRSAVSSEANLSNLSLSSGTLSPAFAAGTTSYTASVSNATTSISVTPTVADSTSLVSVEGSATTSGNASGAVPLSIGANTITTLVTAQNGTTKSYTIVVTRAGSSNAQLSALSLSSGTLSPAFASGTTSYTASVSNATTAITVTPTVVDANSTIAVNGTAVTSGSASNAFALAVGSNTFTTIVTAQNGTTTNTYTVTVTRAGSSNNNLSGLSISANTLTPTFASSTTSYTTNVTSSIGSTRVTATAAVSTASITVNGDSIASGSQSDNVALAYGQNAITVVVTAQNGTTKTYSITVTRALPSSNSSLSALSLSSGTLSPTFAAGTRSYTASVGNATTSITATATLADVRASVRVNGTPVTSGSASGALPLVVGINLITVIVTAEDDTTTSYAVTVTRAASSNSALSALGVSSGTLSPAFAAGTLDYSVGLANSETSLTVTPTVDSSTATVTVEGASVTSGNASDPIAVPVGTTDIDVIVTAQNGTTTTYTIAVERAESSNSALSALGVSSGTLSPAFAASALDYSARLANSVSSLTVTPTVDSASATVTVDGETVTSGSASAAITIPVGTTDIDVVVTAQNGTTTTYTIAVERAESSNSALSGLDVADGTLSPAFTSGTTAYTLETAANSITVTPTVADATATVDVNGVMTVSGSPSATIALPLGATTITTSVTAEDGSTTDYMIVVTRTGAPVVELDHDLVVGEPADGSEVTFTGVDLEPGSTWTVTLHSTPVVLDSGTIGLDGLLNVTVTLPAGIDPGAHRVALVITPPAGAAITSTIWFTVLGDGTVGAISLLGPVLPAALSVTGVDAESTLAWIAAALLALLVGLALIVWRRRAESSLVE